MKKKIAFGCDHRGFEIKEMILHFLKKTHYEVMDCGTNSKESVDYTGPIFEAATKLSRGECDLAIGVCYTGIGSTIAANKVKGVRAALVHSVKEAELSRAHNDANMLILGAGFVDRSLVPVILETWLNTSFEGGRHERRVNNIKGYEEKNYC